MLFLIALEEGIHLLKCQYDSTTIGSNYWMLALNVVRILMAVVSSGKFLRSRAVTRLGTESKDEAIYTSHSSI